MLVGMSSDRETCDPTDQLRCLDQPKHTMYIGQLVQVEKRTTTAERVGSKGHLASFFDSGGGGMPRIRKSEKMCVSTEQYTSVNLDFGHTPAIMLGTGLRACYETDA
jgi:hypothetical protein